MAKQWLIFTDPAENELCAYTVSGTFEGEMQATKELLAAEHGVSLEDIAVRLEEK